MLLDRPDNGTGERPEVSRGEPRQMLLDSLPDGIVHRGRKVSGVQALDEGGHELRFTDGATVRTSLLVGADGAWSRIRPLLSDATPEYVGVTSVEYFLFDGDTRHRATAEAVGAGSLFALSPGRGFLAYREKGGTLHTYVQLAEYEQAMFPRAAAEAAGEDIYDMMLGGDAPHSWIAMMNDAEQAS